MDVLGKALEIAMRKFKEELGENAQLENDDEFVTCFDNCTLILSMEDNQIGVKFIGGKAYQSDYKVPFYGDSEVEG